MCMDAELFPTAHNTGASLRRLGWLRMACAPGEEAEIFQRTMHSQEVKEHS